MPQGEIYFRLRNPKNCDVSENSEASSCDRSMALYDLSDFRGGPSPSPREDLAMARHLKIQTLRRPRPAGR